MTALEKYRKNNKSHSCRNCKNLIQEKEKLYFCAVSEKIVMSRFLDVQLCKGRQDTFKAK